MAQHSIFISYREADTGPEAFILYQSLIKNFGEDEVFYDKKCLPLGAKWDEILEQKVAEAKVVIVMYKEAKKWLGEIENPGGKNSYSIEDPIKDWIHREVKTSLLKVKRVIPLLINHTKLPDKKDLPDDLQPLLDHQGLGVRQAPAFWETDLLPLISEIEKIVQKAAKTILATGGRTCSICNKYFSTPQAFQIYVCDHPAHKHNDVTITFAQQVEIESNYAIVGATESGKSCFIYSFLHSILIDPPKDLRKYMEEVNMHFELVGDDAIKQFRHFESMLLSGHGIPGTAPHNKENNTPINLIIRIGRGIQRKSIRVSFFDLAGEFFSNKFDSNGWNFMDKDPRIHQAKGIIFLASPFEDVLLNDLLDENATNQRPEPFDSYKHLHKAIRENNSQNMQKQIFDVPTPIAFCVSMFDLLERYIPEKVLSPYKEIEELMNKKAEFDFYKSSKGSIEFRNFLNQNSNLPIRDIEDRFRTVNYFAISSVGHNDLSRIPTRGLSPKGILAPLFWLLAQSENIPFVNKKGIF